MEKINILFLLIQLYFITTSINAVRKTNKKKSSDSKSNSFALNKIIQYSIDDALTDRVFDRALNSFEYNTCIKFVRSSHSSSNTLSIKKGDHCSATAEIKNKAFHYSITVNQDCMSFYYVIKLLNLNIYMRYQLIKCLASKQGHENKPITEKDFKKLLKKYKCKIKTFGGANVKTYKSKLTFSTVKIPYKKNIYPKDLKQIDYNTMFSFSDARKINEIMCSNKCKESKIKCKNGGYWEPKSCSSCECPWFYTGEFCEKYMASSLQPSCGKTILISSKKKQSIKLNFNEQCFYNIKPSSKKKRIMVFFTNSKPVHWDCKAYEFIEIKFNGDELNTGLCPCGKITKFSVKSKKGSIVMIRQESSINHGFDMTMEYKEF